MASGEEQYVACDWLLLPIDPRLPSGEYARPLI